MSIVKVHSLAHSLRCNIFLFLRVTTLSYLRLFFPQVLCALRNTLDPQHTSRLWFGYLGL